MGRTVLGVGGMMVRFAYLPGTEEFVQADVLAHDVKHGA